MSETTTTKLDTKLQVNFTVQTENHGTYSDALYIPLYENLSEEQRSIYYTDATTVNQSYLDTEINNRVTNWVYILENPPVVEPISTEDQVASINAQIEALQAQLESLTGE